MNPESEINEIRRIIAEDFEPPDREAVYEIVEPFTTGNSRLARAILHLAQGRKKRVAEYAEYARVDYRDVLMWAENPEASTLRTPEEIEEFQELLEWAGSERDPNLDEMKRQMESGRAKSDAVIRRPWWKFW